MIKPVANKALKSADIRPAIALMAGLCMTVACSTATLTGSTNPAVAQETGGTEDFASGKTKVKQSDPKLQSEIRNFALRDFEGFKPLPEDEKETSIVTYRDINGNVIHLTNPNSPAEEDGTGGIIRKDVEGIDLLADISGFEDLFEEAKGEDGVTIKNQRYKVTKVIPSVTIYAEGSKCFWYCEKNGSITCYRICY